MGFVILLCLGDEARSVGSELGDQLDDRLAGSAAGLCWLVASYNRGSWSCRQAGHKPPTTFDSWHALQDWLSGCRKNWWEDSVMLVMSSCTNSNEWKSHCKEAVSIHDQLRSVGRLPEDRQRRGLVLLPADFWPEWKNMAGDPKSQGLCCPNTLLVSDAIAPGSSKAPLWPDGIQKTVLNWLLGYSLLTIKDRGKIVSFMNHRDLPYGSICVQRTSIVDVDRVSESFVNAGLRKFLQQVANSKTAGSQDLTSLIQDIRIPVLKSPARPGSATPSLPWRCKSIKDWLKRVRQVCAREMRQLSIQWQEALIKQKQAFEENRRTGLHHLLENLAGKESVVLRAGGIDGIGALVFCLKGEIEKRKFTPSVIRWLSSRRYTDFVIKQETTDETAEHWKSLHAQPETVSLERLLSDGWRWWVAAIMLLIAGYYVPGRPGWALIIVGPVIATVPVLKILRKRRDFKRLVEIARDHGLSDLSRYFEQAAADQKKAADEKRLMDIYQVIDRRIRNWEAWTGAVQARMQAIDHAYPDAPPAFLQTARMIFNQSWENFLQNLGRTDRVNDAFESDILAKLLEAARCFVQREWEGSRQKQEELLAALTRGWERWPQQNQLLAPVDAGTVFPTPFLLYPYSGDKQVSDIAMAERLGLQPVDGLDGEFIILGVNPALGLAAFNAARSPEKEGGK